MTGARNGAGAATQDPAAIANLPYRRGVGVVLFNREAKVFAAQRIDAPGPAWQLPQGGIDAGEAPRDAAMREMEEEIGTANAEIIGETRDWIRYDLPPEIVPRVWGGRFRGQEQKWFALRFLGDDSDIDIETEHPEFSAWRWVAFEDLPDLIVAFKQPLYLALVDEFRDLAASLRRS